MGGSVPPLRPQAPPPALTPALVDQSRRWKFPARGLTRRSFTAGTWGERAAAPPPSPPTGSHSGAGRPDQAVEVPGPRAGSPQLHGRYMGGACRRLGPQPPPPPP